MKICYRCGKRIKNKEKQVEVMTKDKGEITGDDNFHWKCWIDYFEECVTKKLKAIQEKIGKSAQYIFRNLERFINNRTDEVT